MTAELMELADWLTAEGCTHVAMESTGVYWKPIWNLLEQRFHLLLVNARHIKAVPGRKTDVHDSEWIADLLQHGLLQGSFVPERAQRELRELTRYRTTLVRERTAQANRLQKTLEGANIKLAAVATDILGTSGRQMLAALAEGSLEPAAIADLAKGLLRKKLPQLEQALTGQVDTHQRFLIRQHLVQIEGLETAVADVSAEIAARLRPVDDVLTRLDTIPGIGRWVAEALVAELGTDMSRFPSSQHLASPLKNPVPSHRIVHLVYAQERIRRCSEPRCASSPRSSIYRLSTSSRRITSTVTSSARSTSPLFVSWCRLAMPLEVAPPSTP